MEGCCLLLRHKNNHYTVLHLGTMKQETVSIKRLKEYLLDEDIDPQQVANQATKRDG